MTGDLESAFRQLLKSAIQEVTTELLRERGVQHATPSQQRCSSDERLLLTSRDAAKRLAISERHLYTLTRSGVVPCVRLGQCVRYSVETIQRWIRESESRAVSIPLGTATTKKRRSATQIVTPTSTSIQRTTRKRVQPNIEGSPVARKSSATKRSRRQEAAPKAEERERPTPFDLLLREIGVDRKDVPAMTNGDLMRIAAVDIATCHGWLYLNRELPEAALERLRCHFRSFRRDRSSPDS